MNTEKSHQIKIVLFRIVLIILVMPLIQQVFSLLEIKPLGGSIFVIEKPVFSTTNWFNEKFQTDFEKYENQNFGFRNIFVRINNQIEYSVNNIAKANSVIIGKEEYLYEDNYIKEYFGLNYVGEQKVVEMTSKLKKIQDTLKKLNKDMIVLLAPGKGTFYPEFIPERLRVEKGLTNYAAYVREFKKNGINVLDFNKWFLEMKPTTKYPLYGKCGIHWSKYAELLAADSLVKYFCKTRCETISRIIIDEIVVNKHNVEGDYDIGDGMNLLFEMDVYPMAYPKFHITENLKANNPKVLFVADSYYWGMFNSGFSAKIFNNGQFWFYNEQIFPDSYQSPKAVADIDIKLEVEKNDAIVLLTTDANLYKFGFGFIDQLYEKYYGSPAGK